MQGDLKQSQEELASKSYNDFTKENRPCRRHSSKELPGRMTELTDILDVTDYSHFKINKANLQQHF